MLCVSSALIDNMVQVMCIKYDYLERLEKSSSKLIIQSLIQRWQKGKLITSKVCNILQSTLKLKYKLSDWVTCLVE